MLNKVNSFLFIMCHFKILILNYKITCVLSHHVFLKPPYFLSWFQNLSFRALKERNLFFRAWFFKSHSFNMKINSFQCSAIYIFYWIYILKGKIPILDYLIWHTFTCIFHIYLYISFFCCRHHIVKCISEHTLLFQEWEDVFL